MERYLLQQSENPNHWVCTDTVNGIVCVWKQGEFNDTQKFTLLESVNLSASGLAKLIHEMTDWLSNNHYDKAMK